MRFLALETNVEVLKKNFLIKGEKAVLTVHRHFVVFVLNIFWQAIASLLILAATAYATAAGWWGFDVTFWILLAWGLVFLYFLSSAYVQWKYNFLIVTTQKVVIIEQKSMFYQHINPLHFESISNTRVESQFLGIFRCGVLYINMKVPEMGGKYMELANHFIPRAEEVAAIIENGLAVKSKPLEAKDEAKKQKAMQEPAVHPENPQPDVLREQQNKEGIGLGPVIANEPPPPEKA